MSELLGHLHWTRTGETDRILVREIDQCITRTGNGFLNKNWEGQYLETLRDFCRQEGIELTLRAGREEM